MSSDVDPTDRATWVAPVEECRDQHLLTGVNQYRAEYNIPMSPNALIMAVILLPPDIPRGPSAFLRTSLAKSNVERDGQHLGGFIIEARWPESNLDDLPLDTGDDRG